MLICCTLAITRAEARIVVDSSGSSSYGAPEVAPPIKTSSSDAAAAAEKYHPGQVIDVLYTDLDPAQQQQLRLQQSQHSRDQPQLLVAQASYAVAPTPGDREPSEQQQQQQPQPFVPSNYAVASSPLQPITNYPPPRATNNYAYVQRTRSTPYSSHYSPIGISGPRPTGPPPPPPANSELYYQQREQRVQPSAAGPQQVLYSQLQTDAYFPANQWSPAAPVLSHASFNLPSRASFSRARCLS
uniref:PDZ domain-containing protein n=1 Tax=Trichogramma kaykai TaxID=54128 RepID=A0ABD2WXG6_9HYME